MGEASEGLREHGGRRLLVVSTGSYEASIVGRNALERMRFVALEGFFEEVHYVFFRVPEPSVRHLGDGFTIYEVSGDPAVPLLERIPLVRPVTLGLTGLAEIQRIAAAVNPDVVTVVDPFLSGLLGWRVARRRRIPLVVHVLSNYFLSWKAAGVHPFPAVPVSLAFALEKAVLRRADLVLADRGHYRDYAVGRGAPPERVEVVPMYADAVFHERRVDPSVLRRIGVEGDGVLAYVGRLSPEKYAFDLLEAFRIVSEAFPGHRLLVVGGDGPLKAEFLERAGAVGVRDRILVRSDLDSGEMVSVLAAADVVLAPHGGYSLLEAALAGAPIVAYDYEWHPELIRDGQNGILVPYRDASAMGRAAVALLRDPERAARLGEAARAEARDRYDHERIREAFRESYARVLEQAR